MGRKKVWETVLVDVTEKDIQKGEQFSPNRCPVALAIRRAIPQLQQEVSVGIAFFLLKRSSMNGKSLPVAAQKFISKFDSRSGGRESVRPFTFKIQIRVEKGER